jgi:2-dehydro-3-deoxygluconokinase
VCLTARQSISSKRGAWTSMALAGNEIAHGKPVEFDVVDRLGTGDAFFAGFLYASTNFDVKYALDFGNALCALAHTVEGDVAEVSADEVHEILQSGYDFRVRR